MSEEWLRGRLQEEKDNAKHNLAKAHDKYLATVKKLDELQIKYNELKEVNAELIKQSFKKIKGCFP